MSFDEAMQLARAIRKLAGWYVLEVSPASGEQLEVDKWSVMAICTLNWHYFHYWNRAGCYEEFVAYAQAFENGARRRASSHER